MTTSETNSYPVSPCILAYAPRDRARPFLKSAFPRRTAHLIQVRTAKEFDIAIRRELTDAVIVDMVSPGDESWEVAGRVSDFPSIPFFALIQSRTSEVEIISRVVDLGFADVLTEMMDEESARALVEPLSYTARFARALHDPPPVLGLTSEAQRKTWVNIVERGGRPVTTRELALMLGITREHLSRNFAQGSGPNLKRIIDLVRLLSAAELAKNPGYDIRDVASVLDFASSSHLAVTTQRIASTRPASLSGLRTVDLIERFTQGRTRSRGPRQVG